MKSKLLIASMAIFMAISGFKNANATLTIHFKNRPKTVKNIILQNNREEFMINMAQNEKWRIIYFDTYNRITIKKRFLIENFLEKDTLMYAYYYNQKDSSFTKFIININKDTINLY